MATNRNELLQEIKKDGDKHTLALIVKFLQAERESLRDASENETGVADIKIKGQLKECKELSRIFGV